MGIWPGAARMGAYSPLLRSGESRIAPCPLTSDVVMMLEPAWEHATAIRERQQGSLSTWPFAAALVLSAVFWLLAWYGDTAGSIVAIWSRSDTFAHGYLIVPISAWLIWRRRRIIAALESRPNHLVLALLALAGFAWLLGHLAQAGVVQQYALVLMIPLLVWSILGNDVAKAIAFPLFFLLFAVPFGEFLELPLMEYTADFAVAALRMSGIPVFRDGQLIMIPSGSWSVVEACSGLRYLIASLTLGFLYAHLTYTSLARRAAFVAASVIVPIVANWLRAYMIIMIGHLSGMKYAAGVDHLIYGWLFFGLVMVALFWVGSLWREDAAPPAAATRILRPQRPGRSALTGILAATIAAAATVAVWPLAAFQLEDAVPASTPVLRAPAQAGGWRPVAARLTGWTPLFSSPQALVKQVYEKDAARVELFLGYYRQQSRDAKLTSSQNMLVSTRNREWRNAGETHRRLELDDAGLGLISATLRGASTQLLVWRWYWIDGTFVVNPYWAKLLQAKSELLGRGGDGAVVMVYTLIEVPPGGAERTLEEFVGAMLPAITASLESARRDRP